MVKHFQRRVRVGFQDVAHKLVDMVLGNASAGCPAVMNIEIDDINWVNEAPAESVGKETMGFALVSADLLKISDLLLTCECGDYCFKVVCYTPKIFPFVLHIVFEFSLVLSEVLSAFQTQALFPMLFEAVSANGATVRRARPIPTKCLGKGLQVENEC